MVYPLKHDTEPDTFIFTAQCQCIRVFRNVTITDKSFISAVDKSVIVHVTVF